MMNCAIKTRPPTYLSELGVDENEIILNFKLLNQRCETPTKELNASHVIEKTYEDADLDVTGSPLKVDLGGNESFISFQEKKTFASWTNAEAHHQPFSVQEARNILSEYFLNGNEQQSPSMYVVCDGCDNDIVALGAKKDTTKDGKKCITTCLVKMLGLLPKNHENITLASMETAHLQRCRPSDSCMIDYSATFKYYLYGYCLRNMDTSSKESNRGSVCIEEKCQKRCSIDTQNTFSNRTLRLQIVAGHSKSSVSFLWQELCLLQNYLDILSSGDWKNDPVISQISSNTSSLTPDIQASIKNLIQQFLVRSSYQIDGVNDFSLQNIRRENVMDGLWRIMKCSENLSQLTENFYFFFEELVDLKSIIMIPETNKTDIAALINRITEKGFTPNLTDADSLQFLFELGVEKLKNDYREILRQFNVMSAEAIDNNWHKIQNAPPIVDEIFRKTRRTFHITNQIIDLTIHNTKLAYLGRLHTATEFIYLVKEETHLSEHAYNYFCTEMCKHYVRFENNDGGGIDRTKRKFLDLQLNPLCEFSVVISSTDKDVVNEMPFSWCMRMSSTLRNKEVYTTYHLSKVPIFPTSIYDKYVIDETLDEKEVPYYVTKFKGRKLSYDYLKKKSFSSALHRIFLLFLFMYQII